MQKKEDAKVTADTASKSEGIGKEENTERRKGCFQA